MGNVTAPVRVGRAPNEFEPAPIAVFATQAEANEVGLACRWSNQTYRIKRTTAPANVQVTGEVISCHAEYAR